MANTVEGEYEIINVLGLHARAAAQLVQVANRYASEVSVTSGGQTVNGKSIMGVLMLAAALGSRVRIQCTGADAEACLKDIAQLIANRFGEAQ